MTDWLYDTLVWTAALIALVLLVRRPVARWFGPQIAYALWILPFVRLILPPIILPSWLAPKEAPAGETMANLFPDQAAEAPFATHTGFTQSTPETGAASQWSAPITPPTFFDTVPWVEIGCVVWLLGAAIFLLSRFHSYFELRSELLDGAREVGRAGKIRLVETEGTQAPLAFGVLDPVIAMPDGFMAQADRNARDLALAHEFAHHRGGDLLINILVQPLFALHWFNPLGRYGWLALRRDQEAACDARVMAAKPAEDRAVYAGLIASFAAGPNVALAAPMACPVLGDKSIIHRLRSLNMSDTSLRRRMTGRFMVGAAVLALPLTASISYAENTAPEPPEPPVPPAVTIAPPPPPAPPKPPAPVLAPAAQTIISVDPDVDVDVDAEADRERKEKVVVIRDVDETRRDAKAKRREKVHVVSKNHGMSDEEMAEILAEVREGLAEADAALKDVPHQIEEALIEIEDADQKVGRTVVKMECDSRSKEVASTLEGPDGSRVVMICESRITAQALKGLKEARKAIAKNPQMSDEFRAKIIAELDEKIAEWKKKSS